MPHALSQFQFLTAADLRFGRGVAHAALDALAGLGGRLLLVQGHDGSRADWLVDALTDHGAVVCRFSVEREPDLPMIEAGLAVARGARVEAVIALGGGAVIDAGKALAGLIPSTRPIMDHLEVVGRGLPLEARPLPFAAMPTTAGTGAEVTKNAVIAVPEAKRKVSLRDRHMLPDLALVDPSLTDHLPKPITLASGLDAVTQVIEPFLSCKANRLTDALCRDAIPQGLKALVLLMERESKEARDDLAWTSLCGGLALANAGLGAVHGFAGVLGGVTGAAHGAICGALLPHVLAANETALMRLSDQEAILARMQAVRGWIAEAVDCDAQNAFDCLARWSQAQGLPGLKALGLTAEMIGDVAEQSRISSSMKGNPVALDSDLLTGILGRAL
ncbi:iron-containing alcohol dehydrogenase [Cohaesibacter intestini]|uniref:iron-containing alcohol dehydrogenase n=1 Tax=Cohaesibacter intestini TaxID=2211145 RepID=UPI000DE9AF7A|nr:iron-containing alcohol dehydrogenase [Cohaesibacter intestini]